MNPDELRRAVNNIHWRHTIDLGNGIVTPGNDDSPTRLRALALPKSLKGKTVLDIGAWDGFYSFESERRGADRVVALDSYCWSGSGPGTKAGFETARRALGSRVEDVEMEVLDISPKTVGEFDVVLFLGVLYHMRHPLLALESVFSVTKELLIMETHVDLLASRRPAMVFYPDAELNNDASNWWGPNQGAVKGMLRTAGFRRIETISQGPSVWTKLNRAARLGLRRQAPVRATLNQGRMVFHAWR